MKSPVSRKDGSKCFKLNPSDLVFLWEECRRCFWLKVICNIVRPSIPIPKIFNRLDHEMKARFHDRKAEEVVPNMPPGVLTFKEMWVESKPIPIPGRSASCYIRGKFDVAAKLDDGTFGVVDLKTSERNTDHIPLYGRQVHAYALALENAAPGKPFLSPVSRLGLLVYGPDAFYDNSGVGLLCGRLSWIEIPRDDRKFMAFLSEVVLILEAPSPPPLSPACPWCQYHDAVEFQVNRGERGLLLLESPR
jgi:hypothetical protein